MKRIFTMLLALSLLNLNYSCSDDGIEFNTAESGAVDSEKIILGLKKSYIYFNNKNSSYKTKNYSSSIEEEYKENLKYINNQTGLDLKFDEEEFKKVISSLKDNETGEFDLSYDSYLKNIEAIKENGDYELFLETKKIVEEVYSQNTTDMGNAKISSRISFSCGLAIAGDVAATIGLAACGTGVGCPLAIASKIIAYASVIDSCS